MVSSVGRAAILVLLSFYSSAQTAEQKGVKHTEKDDTMSASPVIIELERDTERVASGKEKNFYSAMMSVGGPKAQEFRMGFDLGGGTTLLPSKDCTTKACRNRKQYSKMDSSTAEDVQRDGKLVVPGDRKVDLRRKRFLARDVGTLDFTSVELGPGGARGFFVRDKVCIDFKGEQTKCFSYAFMSATIMTDDPFIAEPYDGIVGLGLGTGGMLSNDFDFLYRITHAVPRSMQGMFGLHLGSGLGGEIAFGGYDRKRITSPISWAPVVDEEQGRWQVAISAIRIQNKTLDVCSGGQCLAALDFGTSLLSVPSALEGHLEKQISTAGPGKCELSTVPDLQLILNGVTVTVPVQDYSPSAAQGHFNGGPCLPDLEVHNMDQQMKSGSHLFILGESVLRRYYTIYDTDSKRVGFSLAAKDDDDDHKKPSNNADKAVKDDNYVVLLVQVTVKSSKTRSSLGVAKDTDQYML